MIYLIGFIWFFTINNCLIIEFYTTLQIVILSKVARDLFTRYKLTAINWRDTVRVYTIGWIPTHEKKIFGYQYKNTQNISTYHKSSIDILLFF